MSSSSRSSSSSPLVIGSATVSLTVSGAVSLSSLASSCPLCFFGAADGIDLYFLNRPGFNRVASSAQVAAAFGPPPSGFTPLAAAVTRILVEKASVIAEKKLLLVIATDGEPTNTNGQVDIPGFASVLQGRHANVFVSIIACTDDEDSVGYLNKFDRSIPHLDVTDDFQSERSEIQRAQGAAFRFSFGDYVVKSLLGSIDNYFDHLDEKPVGGGGCCIVA